MALKVLQPQFSKNVNWRFFDSENDKKTWNQRFFYSENFQKMRKTEGSLISKLKKNPELKVMFIKSDNCPTIVLALFSSMIIFC